MGDAEYSAIKEDVTEIKASVKEVQKSVNELQVMLAGQYVTKEEFVEHKREEQTTRRWWATFIIAAAGILMTLVNLVGKYITVKGGQP